MSIVKGSMSVDKECGSGRRSVSLPSRYLEELENVSSPGVVSKKAAYFEEAIRSASSEKCVASHSTRGARRNMNQVDEAENDDGTTARVLDFSSDSEPATEREPEAHSCTESQSPPDSRNSPGAADEATELQFNESQYNGCKPEVLKENQDPSEDRSGVSNKVGVVKYHEACCKPVQHRAPALHKGKLASLRSSLPKTGGTLRSSCCGGVPATVPRSSASAVSRSTSFMTLRPASADKRRLAGETAVGEDTARLNARPASAGPVTIPSRTSQASGNSRRAAKEPPRLAQAVHHHPPAYVTSLAGRATSARKFVLKSDERAEKRKEFYTKLEERLAAKEQERNQLKAKTQEEMEADIRKLRQSLTFKAKPMPSFYHESSSQTRRERKRVATTRPVSPKLGRHRATGAHHTRLCKQEEASLAPARSRRAPSSSSSSKSSSPEAVNLVADDCSVFLKEEDEAILLAGA